MWPLPGGHQEALLRPHQHVRNVDLHVQPRKVEWTPRTREEHHRWIGVIDKVHSGWDIQQSWHWYTLFALWHEGIHQGVIIIFPFYLSNKEEFVQNCYAMGCYCTLKTGVFLIRHDETNPENQYVELQNGVIRSNCVDSLDRTNSFQLLIGEMALQIQLNKINRVPFKSF
jgi:hypothetical protein